jgi:crotonobetaine/carnitine-CoA ligase
MASNLTRLLIEKAAQRPDLTVGTVDDQVTLAEALAIAAGHARVVRPARINRDHRVAIVASSSTGYLIAWMACLLAGTPVALVNPTYPPELLAQMLDRLDPALVITDLGERDFVGDRRVLALSGFRTGESAATAGLPGVDAAPSDIASFMHTSGTTGIPKYCAQTHQYFVRLGAQMAASLGLTSGDRMLAPLPLFHINPLGYGIIGALSAGADALTVGKFSASRFWPTVKEHGITALALHAPPVEILKRATSAEDADGHQVRTMFYADAEFMARFGIDRAVSGYGSTEAAGVSHLHLWRLGEDIPANASRYGGSPRSDIEDRLDDSGQIFVRETEPNTLFAGYFANGRIDPTCDSDGWFATGDLGRRDEHGGLVFLERAAESIRVNGEFVPIPFVEERLGTIGELKDLALWKKPGELVDDAVVLYVVADPVPVDTIRAVAAELPAFMRPTHIAQIESMPRDAAAGKVQRRLLHGQPVVSWIELS